MAFQDAHRNRRFEAYSCMCRRLLHELYQNLYITKANTRTRFATNIKIKGENLPSHWSAVQPDSIKREILTIRFPFILTTLYIPVHVAILAAQFLFFFKFLQLPLQMREYQKIRSSELWRRQNIE